MRDQSNNKPNTLNVQQLPSSSQSEQEQAQQYDTFLYKFQQQIIDAWKPVPHTSSNIILYSVLSVVCIGLGLALILTAPNAQQINVRYDNACSAGSTGCTVSFTLTQTLSAPIYMYYTITNFYQNHRRYIKFFSSSQLSTGTLSQSDAASSCGDFVTNSQLGYSANYYNNDTLTGTNTGFPCGTAGRMYNMFRPELVTYGLKYSNGTIITLTKSGIAWPSDIGRYKDYDLNKQPFSIQQQNWLVWYRPGAREGWHKLFAIVNTDLVAGAYLITFDNTFDASGFGQKYFYVGKSNYMGNRDLFLGIAFLVLGGGCFILLIVFIAKWIAQKRDKPHYT